MIRSLAIAAALIALPSVASAEPMYLASLVQPADTTLVVRDAQWICRGGSCSAPRTATSADATVCAAVARKLGQLSAFTSGERAFDTAQIGKCNAAAGK